MSSRAQIALRAVAVAIGVLLLWQAGRKMYFAERASLLSDLEDAEKRLAMYERTLDEKPRLERELDRVVACTLGPDVETVDHKLRTRLNRIAEEVGLRDATVGTRSPASRKSPARRTVFRGRSALTRELRDMIDFTELGASISGSGELGQIVRLIDQIEAEPWIKRIDMVRIDPKDGGTRFDVAVQLTTLFLPGKRAPENGGEQAIQFAAYDESRLVRFASLIESNPFRVPSAPPPVAQATTLSSQATQGPPPFPYAQWTLTGVAKGLGGLEVWLLNRSTGQRRVLMRGEALADAKFVGLSTNDAAQFIADDKPFIVYVGQHLGDRTPVKE